MSVDIFPSGITSPGNNTFLWTATRPTTLADLTGAFDVTCYLQADGVEIDFDQARDNDTRGCDSSTRESFGATTFTKDEIAHIVDPQGVRSEYYYVPQPSQLPARLHNTTWVADRSIDFLQQRDQDRPFFMWTSFIKPHPPFENPIPWNRMYKPDELECLRAKRIERIQGNENHFVTDACRAAGIR